MATPNYFPTLYEQGMCPEIEQYIIQFSINWNKQSRERSSEIDFFWKCLGRHLSKPKIEKLAVLYEHQQNCLLYDEQSIVEKLQVEPEQARLWQLVYSQVQAWISKLSKMTACGTGVGGGITPEQFAEIKTTFANMDETD